MEREKLKDRAAEINRIRNETKSSPTLHNGMPSTSEKEGARLPPFFWLREEVDMDKSTQQTDDNLVMYTPQEAPCFSDIKDLDDEIRNGNLSNNADFIDSEMFEWTQRPCSPELCSSPTIQIEDHTAEEDVALKSVEANSTGAAGPKTRSTSTGSKLPTSRAGLGNVIYQDLQEGNNDTPLVQKGKSRKGKRVLFDASVQEKNVLSDEVGPLANSKGEEFIQVSASENCGKSNEERTKLRKRGEDDKNFKKPTQPPKSGSKEETENFEIGKKCLDIEQDKGGSVSQMLTNLHPPGMHEEISDGCVKRKYGNICRKSPSSGKTVKFTVEIMCKDNHDGKALGANENDATRDHLIERDRSDIKTPSKVDIPHCSLGRHALLKCNTSPSTIHCAFCQSSEESEASGIMVHYVGGKLVTGDARKNAIHVHKKCAQWAPNVYFEDDTVVNLENELLTPECRWDSENFVMLCPIHKSFQLPNDNPQSQSRKKSKLSAERKSLKTNKECKDRSPSQWKSQKRFKNLVFCCSALTNTEKETVGEFENLFGVIILKNWDPTVTHVIASTDENGACRRTLKFLMAVLEGKWILSVQWIKACIEAGDIAGEEQFQISVDIHGIRDGPKLGRLRLLNKQPKLFDGCTFFFMGDFAPSYRGYLHDLVIAAGGKVLNRKPVAGDQTTALNGSSKTAFIIYSVELPQQCKPYNGSSVMDQRRACAEASASSAEAMVASNSWIMNSIVGCKLQTVSK
ncbi:protein BREAST CANCER SUSCEPTIBILITY 1 [Salvia divinorum]|uniref:Protein BREAST CANCER SUSCEPTIBILITY 1 n=1 Tax=Salvia divinorum TaxID=28513 RepID=A0ABD1HX75_SALDI